MLLSSQQGQSQIGGCLAIVWLLLKNVATKVRSRRRLSKNASQIGLENGLWRNGRQGAHHRGARWLLFLGSRWGLRGASLNDCPRLRLRVERWSAVDRRPFVGRALERSALGLERKAATALHAAVVAAVVAAVADLQTRLVLLGRDRLAAVGHKIGQRAGKVPGLASQ